MSAERSLLESGDTGAAASRDLPSVDPEADQQFRALLAASGFEPDGQFSADYVAWEWRHARHLFQSLPLDVAGARVLEVGCNVGATGVVLALLGARVTAVDVSARCAPVTRANARRFGVADRVRVARADGRRLPFADASFDIVACNSVLEYVPPAALPQVEAEVGRVLRRGGLAVVLGTSSRLWPKEVHSGQWLSNYVPRWADRLASRLGRPLRLRRGVTPWMIRAGFAGYEDVLAEDASEFVALKKRMGASPAKVRALSAAGRVLQPLGISVASLLPTLTMVLRKP